MNAGMEFFNVSVEKTREFSTSVEKSIFSRGFPLPFCCVWSKERFDAGGAPQLFLRQSHDLANPPECDSFSLRHEHVESGLYLLDFVFLIFTGREAAPSEGLLILMEQRSQARLLLHQSR